MTQKVSKQQNTSLTIDLHVIISTSTHGLNLLRILHLPPEQFLAKKHLCEYLLLFLGFSSKIATSEVPRGCCSLYPTSTKH